MRIGYARVSTSEQDTSMQVRAFAAAGVSVFFEDSASGVRKRPELDRLLSLLQAGDEVVVYKVDRIARSLEGLLRVLQAVRERGAAFRSLTEPFDTGTLTGRLMLQMLGAFAEFERGMILERCAAGQASAKARGVKLGRNRAFDYFEALQAFEGGATLADLRRRYGISRSGAQRALRAARRERGDGVAMPA